MQKNNGGGKKRRRPALCMAKAVLSAYAASALMLFILAYFLFKCKLNEKAMSLSLAAIYLISSSAAGFFAGKCREIHKSATGLLAGLLYYGILAVVSYLIPGYSGSGASGAVFAFLICAAGGTAGAGVCAFVPAVLNYLFACDKIALQKRRGCAKTG